MAEDLNKALNFKRGLIKSKLTRFKTYFQGINKDSADKKKLISELQLRLQKVSPLYDEFNEVHEQIELSDPENSSNDGELLLFENSYFELVSSMQALFDELNREDSESAVDRSGSSSVSGERPVLEGNVQSLVKLPPIKLPIFNGHYESWLEFKDCFLALVHNNSALSDIQRFYYLRSSLEEEAQQIIKSIEVSSDNYSIAWEMLEERYENKKLIIHNHLKAIFEHPLITTESHVELRNLFDSVTKHLRSLNSLGLQTDTWDSIIIYIVCSKFDSLTRREWECFKYEQDLPSLKDLNKFLKEKCDMLEKLEISVSVNPVNKVKVRHSRSFASVNDNKLRCYYCQKDHPIYKCQPFLGMSINERILTVKKLKLCLNCLRDSHPTWKCKLQKCVKCHRLHNTLLHLNSNINIPLVTTTGAQSQTISNNHSEVSDLMVERVNHNQEMQPTITFNNYAKETCSNVAADTFAEVLLSTALVRVVHDNKSVVCRALLDSGSQSNFITLKLCRLLNLQSSKINHMVKGVGESLAKISNETKILISSCDGVFNENIKCLIIPHITGKIPSKSFNKNSLQIPSDMKLADPNFHLSKDIDLLLGSHIFWSILLPGRRSFGSDMPILQNTELGWVIAGNLYLNCLESNNVSLTCLNLNSQPESISDKIEKFWEIEEVGPIKKVYSKEEDYCQNYFRETTKRDGCGKYIVKIPFKSSVNDLGDSRAMALHRFNLLEKKLSKNIELKKQYSEFMLEYLNMNHMSEVEIINEDGYFLPHHAVLKQSSLTTKCRVVFDGSAKSSSGLSINDVQYVGPSLQQDIFLILIRFRMFKYVLSGDISKMYRQVLIDKKQRKFQKILWRENPQEQLKCYELNTVTYGTASAPYLAVRALLQVAEDNELQFPKIAKIIRRDFYIDDLLTASDTKSEIINIQRNISKVLAASGFELRKWLCNDTDILKSFEVNSNLDLAILLIGEENKTLGLYWDAASDNIKYNINIEVNVQHFQWSKRSILSVICQVYDPLGLLGPIIITAKLIMQDLWKRKLEWDQELPGDVIDNWLEYYNDIGELNQLKIPRHTSISDYVSIELHGFSDASMKAYGCCIFVRCSTSLGKYTSHLLCAKSRVAPLRLVSLPRLELCGAVLLANLIRKVIDSLHVSFAGVYCWTDSTICLHWIKKDASLWKQFVASRVQEIQNLTSPDMWHHVRSEHNPADLLSRGASPGNLIKSSLWWSGPEWLQKSNNEWNITVFEELHEVPETRTITCVNLDIQPFNLINELLNRFSSFNTFLKVLSYIFRFIKNCRTKVSERKSGCLDPIELEEALSFSIKCVQMECFPFEYNALVNKKNISSKSKILSLNPFLHNDVLRVGGRLKNSNIPFNSKHQIILPNKHLLTKRILQSEHERLLHCGAQQLIFSIRQKYWPLSARNCCKNIINQCIRCYKARPKPLNYIMGNLPETRVKTFSVFENIGTDYGGPFLIKDRKTRGAKLTKAYICLFICMSTKAVHIELVSELTTAAFLAALKRFIGRRGKPCNIYSDNGTNYLGANNQLQNIYEFLEENSQTISETLLIEKIKWHFIPSNSPTFGGLWEAGIKSIKSHLKRIVGASSLTFEEFNTLLVQIEGILNSRPLCAMSSDPNDNTALTPAHFLVGKTLTTLPEFDLLDVPENRLDKWKRIQSLVQHLWNRWQVEYLNELQMRQKWKTNCQPLLHIGSLVLVRDDKAPPLQWPLGRVTAVHPGTDGITRIVTVRVRGSETKRALNRVCVLPTES